MRNVSDKGLRENETTRFTLNTSPLPPSGFPRVIECMVLDNSKKGFCLYQSSKRKYSNLISGKMSLQLDFSFSFYHLKKLNDDGLNFEEQVVINF